MYCARTFCTPTWLMCSCSQKGHLRVIATRKSWTSCVYSRTSHSAHRGVGFWMLHTYVVCVCMRMHLHTALCDPPACACECGCMYCSSSRQLNLAMAFCFCVGYGIGRIYKAFMPTAKLWKMPISPLAKVVPSCPSCTIRRQGPWCRWCWCLVGLQRPMFEFKP